MISLEVYKITNLINGKVYIGITSQGTQARYHKHLSDARLGSTFPIHNALRKYGEDNFKIETIETLPQSSNYEELKEREKYWIQYYDSYNREVGYNLTLGGDGSVGYHQSEEAKEKIKKHSSRKHTILQYSIDGELLNEFISLREAERFIGIKNGHTNISACARGKIKQAYGYVWEYKEDLLTV